MARFPISFLWLACFLFSYGAAGQQFGGFPPSTRWMQINTDTVRVIFTPGAEAQANRIATLVLKAAADTPFALGKKLRKVNIVLHSRTTLANGYVAQAPFRSEFFLIPPSNLYDFGNLPWYENLAIHEYRHVQQYNNFRNGLGKGMYYLFGEQGLALANALAIPDWFFEGDAVHTETALSTQGRGRLSWFLSGYMTLFLENRNYKWLKLRNGSMKDYVPDHYQLGYLLVNYGYLKYGEDFWKKVTRDASAFRGLVYPFQKAVEKYAGVDYRTFRKEAFAYYRKKMGNVWKMSREPRKTVTNYYFPQYIGRDSLLFLKTAYNRIPAFYLREGEKEQKLTLRSISSDEWFSYNRGRIAYTAYSTRARWSLVDYSDIVVYDLAQQREKRLTARARYFTPDFSPQGDRIVAVRINDSLQTELDVMDASDGSVRKCFRPAADQYFTHPRYLNDSSIVVGVRNPDARMSLQILHLLTGRWEELIPSSHHTFSDPSVHGDTLFFTANIYGNDDVFAMDLRTRKIFQLTRRYTGTYFPSSNGDSLVLSFFTSGGLQLEKSDLKKAAWAQVSRDALQGRILLFPVAFERPITSIPGSRFAQKRYSKSTGLLHFHSWAPDYTDPEFTFTAYSDNILNTFSTQLYYRYNQNETSHALGVNLAYGGFFPVLNAGAEYTFQRTVRTPSRVITLDQFEFRPGFSIPLNFTRGKTYKYLDLGSRYVFNRAIPTGIYKDSLRAGTLHYLDHFISWSHYLPMAIQHIYPKFGYTIVSNDRHVLGRRGYQFLQRAQLFLPSFGNHSIILSASIQETDSLSTVFTNRFANSRGYSEYFYPRMWRLSGNYHFPIAYPDLGLASIVYLLRLRGNLFYDYTRIASPLTTLRSVGAELYFDTKWWNQLPVSFGVRFSHLLDNGFNSLDRRGSNWVEFILPVGIVER